MLTFYPEFEADEESEVEVILMIDSSNSMKDSSHRDAKKAALLVLHLMDPTWRFNVVSFGTGIVWIRERESERENLIYGYSSVLAVIVFTNIYTVPVYFQIMYFSLLLLQTVLPCF